MERYRVDFSDPTQPERSGAFVLDDGRVYLRASPPLADALRAARDDATADVGPLRFDDRRRGLALASALEKGVRAALLRCAFASGAFELRAYIDKDWVRLTLGPGHLDPDAGWEFLVAVNEASLEAPLL